MIKLGFIGGSLTVAMALALLIDRTSEGPARKPAGAGAGYRIYAPGRIEGTTREVELRPELSGRIVEIPAGEGQSVAAGQVLLKLDDTTYRQEAGLAAAEVELEEATLERLVNGARSEEREEAGALYRAKVAEVERLKKRVKRLNRLRETAPGAVSPEEAEDREQELQSLIGQSEAAEARMRLLAAAARADEVRMARARVSAAKERLELARTQQEKAVLRAPRAAQVLRVEAELGEFWGPQSAEPAVVLADTSRLLVRAFVEELDAPQVRLGMSGTVTADGLRGRSFAARVIRLSPRMGSKQLWTDQPGERIDTKAREVWLELESYEGLVVGLRVDVLVEVER